MDRQVDSGSAVMWLAPRFNAMNIYFLHNISKALLNFLLVMTGPGFQPPALFCVFAPGSCLVYFVQAVGGCCLMICVMLKCK